MFDRVSKKKATSCTPDSAKIEIGVSKSIDPITKKEVLVANDGYDATKDDDTHVCGDSQPTATITASGSTVSITYTHGRHQLQSIEVRSGETLVLSRQVSSDGTYTLTKQELQAAGSGPLTLTVTDSAYYTATDSVNYSG